ncbi:F-actin-uncapping protein LRRC16A-like isoform X1 [Ptychodera flava]|uniref:F-actin-uncapping protein LRRC16A-like isoform X1 n=1 Tax=Ptychodera flava TaxID=63121 RepID=UPI003969F2C8
MSTENSIPKEAAGNIRNELGERGKHVQFKLIKVETKQEKLEGRILVLSVCRAFIFTLPAKSPPKLEQEFHFLDIQSVESTKPRKLCLAVSDKLQVFLMATEGDADEVITHVATSLKKYFPNTPFEKFVKMVTFDPTSRYDVIKDTVDKLTITDQGPCGGFSNMYACMCDYHQLPYREEIAWDVDTIYLSQDTKEMCLNDFDHLEGRDLIPVIAALSYNQWFNKISAKNFRLLPETAKQIVKVLMKNPNIRELELENTGINRWEFGQELALALQAPSSLQVLNLKGNHIDDRGVQHLSAIITKLSDGMTELNLSNTKITAKGRGASNLGNKLAAGKCKKTLKKLKLSDNSFKGDDFGPMLSFLSNGNAVSHLDLSNCDLALETVFPALAKGCLLSLTHLNLSKNQFTHRKAKDIFVPQAMKEYFSTTSSLKYVNLSSNRLPPEVIKDVLLGIACNGSIKDLELDLSSNEMRGEGARVLESCIANIPAISTLNVSDNGFEGDFASVLDWIRNNRHIRNLLIGGNIQSIRQNRKQMNRIVDTIVTMLQDENGSLESLSLSDSKLKADTATVLDAIGSNTILTYLDISGNGMGDVGARILSKALQINTKLKTIKLDRNNISHHGLQDIAAALERNHTIESMPTPVSDAGSAFKSNPEKTESAIMKIEQLLKRNHGNVEFAAQINEQAFRLQQSFQVTTAQQNVDTVTHDVQQAAEQLADCEDESVKADIEEAMKYVEDASNSRELLNKLYAVARETSQGIIDAKVQELKENLTEIVKVQIQKSVVEMLKCGENMCPSVVKDELKTEITETAKQKSNIPETFVADWVEKQAGVAISNKASEVHLAAATAVSNKITDELLDSLADSRRKLNVALYEVRKKRSSTASQLSIAKSEDKEETDKPSAAIQRKRRSVRPVSVLIKDPVSPNTSSSTSSEEAYPSKPLRHHQYETVDLLPPIGQMSSVVEENDNRLSQSAENNSLSSEEDMKTDDSGLSDDKPGVVTGRSTPDSIGSDSLLASPVPDFDHLPASSHTPLKGLTKGRAQRPGRVRPTRAAVLAQQTVEETENHVNAVDSNGEQNLDVAKGVESFFGAKTVIDPDTIRPAAVSHASAGKQRSSSPSSSETEKKKAKKEKKDKKGKDQKDVDKKDKVKDDKKTKKAKEKKDDNKKSISSFFSTKISSIMQKQPTSRDKSPSSKKEKEKSKRAAAEKEKQKSEESLNIYEEIAEESTNQELPRKQEPTVAKTEKIEPAPRKSRKSEIKESPAGSETQTHREDKKESTKTPNETDDGNKDEKNDEEGKEATAKKPMGVPMFGAPMGQGFLAEMKLKQRKSADKLDILQDTDVEEKKESSTVSDTATKPIESKQQKQSVKSAETDNVEISPKPRPRSSRINERIRLPSTSAPKDIEPVKEVKSDKPSEGSSSPVPKPRSKSREQSPAKTISPSASPKLNQSRKNKQETPENTSVSPVPRKQSSKIAEQPLAKAVEAETQPKAAVSEKNDESEASNAPIQVKEQPAALAAAESKTTKEPKSEKDDKSENQEKTQAVPAAEETKLDKTVKGNENDTSKQENTDLEVVKTTEETTSKTETEKEISVSKADKSEPSESEKQESIEPQKEETIKEEEVKITAVTATSVKSQKLSSPATTAADVPKPDSTPTKVEPTQQAKQPTTTPQVASNTDTPSPRTGRTTDTPSPPTSRSSKPKPPPPIKPKPSLLKKSSKKPDSPPTTVRSIPSSATRSSPPTVKPSPTVKPAKKENEGVVREKQTLSVKARAKLINTVDSTKEEVTTADGKPRSNSLSKTAKDNTEPETKVSASSKSVGHVANVKEHATSNKSENQESVKDGINQAESGGKDGSEKSIEDRDDKSIIKDTNTENTETDKNNSEADNTTERKSSKDATTAAMTTQVKGQPVGSSATEGKSEDELSPEIDLEGEGYVFV